ncbi:glutathione transferase GstA [Utexia brackfieldae]|uniref:glutathione transferase GstA n=1 Tax=Utexia brackfieldae TaxID=3074108 RepID=UPI00370DDE6C
MKLYYSPGACSLSVHIALREAGLNYNLEKVDLRNKKTESGHDYVQINDKGQVPALETNKQVLLTEAAAILQYVADLAPEKNLLAPVGDVERYEIVAWVNFIATELHKNFGPFFHLNASDDSRESAKKVLEAKLDYIEKHLVKHPYIAGNHFTIADCYLFVVLRWCKFVPNLSSHQEIKKFMARIQNRPAVAAVLQEEGL